MTIFCGRIILVYYVLQISDMIWVKKRACSKTRITETPPEHGYIYLLRRRLLGHAGTFVYAMRAKWLLGRAWASPTVMWLTEASAMHYGAYVHGTFLHWLKSHRHATGTSNSLLLTCQLCFQVHNFCVKLHGFAFRKTLHISQDVICWQSWSNNNSKYGLVRQTYTIYYGRTRCFRASWPICFWQ